MTSSSELAPGRKLLKGSTWSYEVGRSGAEGFFGSPKHHRGAPRVPTGTQKWADELQMVSSEAGSASDVHREALERH